MLGVSFDTPADNKVFADAQAFGFVLLSDVGRRVGEAYQVLRPDRDRFAEFPRRISYLIDPAGVIRRSYGVADVSGHADEVLHDIAVLGSAL